MDTRNFVGVKATTLTVTLLNAAGRQDEVKFGVQSNILPDIVLNPGSADFGVVARGQEASITVAIERLGMPTWGFTRMIAAPTFCRLVQADLKESYRSADGVGYNLVITLRPDAPAGPIRDEIRLVTNDPESPSVPVLVTGRPTQARYVIRAPRPFTITDILGNGDGFTLKADAAEPKPLHILTLNYDPAQSPNRGDLRRDFQVRTSLEGEPPATLSVSLRVNP
jgi:hypothetical protein